MGIEEEAKQYKMKNGNKYIKNNDLLFYIISRLDSLEKEDSKQDERLAKVETRQHIFMWLGGIGLACISVGIAIIGVI